MGFAPQFTSFKKRKKSGLGRSAIVPITIHPAIAIGVDRDRCRRVDCYWPHSRPAKERDKNRTPKRARPPPCVSLARALFPNILGARPAVGAWFFAPSNLVPLG